MATPVSTRFIHSSDWQLGMARAFLSQEANARFVQARIDAIAQLGQCALANQAQFLLVAGDVFESNQLSRQIVLRAFDALAALPVPVFLLPGNHDPMDSTSVFRTAEFQALPSHVHVVQDMTPLPVPGVPNVQVVGAPWRTKRPNGDLCAQLAQSLSASDSELRVAVAHGQLDSLAPDANLPELISLAAAQRAFAEHKFHYLALGDRHSVYTPQSLDVKEAEGRIWYSGAPVATAFVEDAPNHALLVELELSGPCRVTTVPIGDWHFVQHHQLLNDAADLEAFARWLAALPNKSNTAVKVSFEGSVNLSIAAQLDDLMETQQHLFASLKRRHRTDRLAVLPDSLDEDSTALAGYAKAAWDALLVDAQHDAEAQGALRLFYRIAQQRS